MRRVEYEIKRCGDECHFYKGPMPFCYHPKLAFKGIGYLLEFNGKENFSPECPLKKIRRRTNNEQKTI